MPPDLRAAVLALPDDEKLKLAEELWDSLSPDALPVPDWQAEELERRRADLEADPGSARPWDEVYRRLKARYAG